MSAVETTFHFARAYSPFALAVVLAAVAIAGWWSLGREASFLSKRTYVALAGLRVLPFLILIVLLMKPVLVYYGQTSLKQQVAIVFDESESMAIADKVFNGVQLGSAAYVLGLGRERTMWPPTDLAAVPSSEQEKAEQGQIGLDENDLEKIKAAQRLALVRRAFGRDRGALLERLRRDFILSVYGFSDHLREMPFGSEISPTALLREIRSDGASTHLGTALQRLVQDLRGQPVAGIVAISDGRNLGGIPPLGAAEVASDARIPVYAVPVGAGGSRDIAITALIAESAVFKGDEFPISARIASRGYSGYSVPVVFECDGAEIESRPVALTGKEQLVTFRHKRAAPGQIKVLVRVRAQEGEETSENNSAESFVRVIDKKIKVLMAEEIPRWDFRYLSNTLLRDEHVELRVCLQQADRRVVLGDKLYLPTFPQTEKELFEFDLIVLGALRPKFLREDQLAMIEKFVSKMGGGVLFMAGENVSPDLWAGTLLEPLLPIRIAGEAKPWTDPDRLELRTSERKLELTDEGRRHSITTLDAEKDTNERVWRDFPTHYWAAGIGGLKPAAQVLVQSIGLRDGVSVPAVVVQPYGLGRVLYVGIDSTWRWRYKAGDRHFVRFWTQAVQSLTMSRLLGQNKRLQIVADRDTYEAGQTASLSVRALDAAFQPRRGEDLPVTIEDQTGKRHEVRAYVEPDREGVYSAVFKIPYEGHFKVTVQDSALGGEETAQLEFDAKPAHVEMREPEADWATLAQVAERSGGAVVPLDHLDRLPQLLSRSRPRLLDRHEQALWDWWPFLALFVTLRTAELALRKWFHMK